MTKANMNAKSVEEVVYANIADVDPNAKSANISIHAMNVTLRIYFMKRHIVIMFYCVVTIEILCFVI